MRLYSFTNFYLSSIQQGIQPAHCISDLFVKYVDESPEKATLFDWATNHKTMICCNGGNSADVANVFLEISRIGSALQLPFVYFHEDEQSLNSALTSCAIVVPSLIYDAAQQLRHSVTNDEFALALGSLNPNETELAMLLNTFSLAK